MQLAIKKKSVSTSQQQGLYHQRISYYSIRPLRWRVRELRTEELGASIQPSYNYATAHLSEIRFQANLQMHQRQPDTLGCGQALMQDLFNA